MSGGLWVFPYGERVFRGRKEQKIGYQRSEIVLGNNLTAPKGFSLT